MKALLITLTILFAVAVIMDKMTVGEYLQGISMVAICYTLVDIRDKK